MADGNPDFCSLKTKL